MSARRNQRLIGEGRGRKVFTHAPGVAIKEATGDEGRLQNLREAILSRLAPPGFIHLARVLDVGEAGRVVAVEQADETGLAAITRRLGADFERRLYGAVCQARRVPAPEPLSLGPGVQAMLDYFVRGIGVSWPDLERVDNWGVRRRSGQWEPLLLDYGTVERPDFFARHRTALAEIERAAARSSLTR